MESHFGRVTLTVRLRMMPYYTGCRRRVPTFPLTLQKEITFSKGILAKPSLSALDIGMCSTLLKLNPS